MDERFLIELFIPQLDRRDDLKILPDILLNDLVSEIRDYYDIEAETPNESIVMLTENGVVYDYSLTAMEAGIRTGQTLVFIVLS